MFFWDSAFSVISYLIIQLSDQNFILNRIVDSVFYIYDLLLLILIKIISKV